MWALLSFPWRLAALVQMLSSIHERLITMSIQMDTMAAAVTAIETESHAAIDLLTQLKADLDQAIASEDPQALTALSARLGEQARELAEAIAAATPAATPAAAPAETAA
jgi:hypothetical protein